MVQIKLGTIVPKDTLKAGEKDGRKWLVGKVDATKGYDRISVWADNASELGTGDDLQVVCISAVTKKNEKYTTREGKEMWVDKYEINATLKPAVNEVGEIPTGFSQLEENIPF